jgi:hypothetical protein
LLLQVLDSIWKKTFEDKRFFPFSPTLLSSFSFYLFMFAFIHVSFPSPLLFSLSPFAFASEDVFIAIFQHLCTIVAIALNVSYYQCVSRLKSQAISSINRRPSTKAMDIISRKSSPSSRTTLHSIKSRSSLSSTPYLHYFLCIGQLKNAPDQCCRSEFER